MELEKAVTEIRYIDNEAKELTELDWARFCAVNNIPTEIATRVQDLMKVVKNVAGHTINIGRIVVMKIIQFVENNPRLIIGMAIGAVVLSLISLIPFIGPMLAPLAMAIGVFVGGAFGAYLDKVANGKAVSDSSIGSIAEGAIEAAKNFLELFIDIIKSIKLYLD